MKFTPATVLAIAAGASAQISLPLPSDLLEYSSSLAAAGNTDAVSAVNGLFAFSDVQSVVAGALAHTLTGADLYGAFGEAANNWVAAQPASAQPLASSVLDEISGRAVTDGLLQLLQTYEPAPGSVPTGVANATITGTDTTVVVPTGTIGNSTAAINGSITSVPTTVTDSSGNVISTNVPKTVGAPAVSSSIPAGAVALTGATGFGAAVIAGAFALVAAL